MNGRKNLEEGILAAKNNKFDRAFELLMPLAQDGTLIAQLWIANLYHFGNGVPEDGTEAIRWYSIAAEQVDQDQKHAGLAHHNLHVIYTSGARNVEPNASLAQFHRKRALELGVDLYAAPLK